MFETSGPQNPQVSAQIKLCRFLPIVSSVVSGEGDPIGGKAFEYTSDADEGSDSDSEDEGCVMPGWRGLNYEQSKPEAEDDDSDSLSGESTDGAHSPIQDDTNCTFLYKCAAHHWKLWED